MNYIPASLSLMSFCLSLAWSLSMRFNSANYAHPSWKKVLALLDKRHITNSMYFEWIAFSSRPRTDFWASSAVSDVSKHKTFHPRDVPNLLSSSSSNTSSSSNAAILFFSDSYIAAGSIGASFRFFPLALCEGVWCPLRPDPQLTFGIQKSRYDAKWYIIDIFTAWVGCRWRGYRWWRRCRAAWRFRLPCILLRVCPSRHLTLYLGVNWTKGLVVQAWCFGLTYVNPVKRPGQTKLNFKKNIEFIDLADPRILTLRLGVYSREIRSFVNF